MDSDLEKKKIHLDTVKQLIFARYNTLPTIATVAAGILVIVTFNNIITVTPFLKWLLVLLLIIIPISLFDFTLKLNRDLNYIIDKHFIDELKQLRPKNKIQDIVDGSNYIYIFLLTIIVLIIVFLIVRDI